MIYQRALLALALCVALTAPEAEIGKRIRLARTEKRLSQSVAALQMGLSRDQLRRVERGEVAIRFFPAWNFCQFSDTSPLWLAFGDPEPRFGFVGCANSNVEEQAGFLEVMERYGERYRTLRFLTHSSWFESASVFSDKKSVLTAAFVSLNRRQERNLEKNIGEASIKHYLITEMLAPPTWEELRTILVARTDSAEAKADLARYLGVSLAAVSQWRSGASAPTADNALKILAWVNEPTRKNKKTPEVL